MHRTGNFSTDPTASSLIAILVACLMQALASTADAAPAADRWLLVDSQALTLTVMHGERPQMTLHNIAIGRYGTSTDRRRVDNTTPLGRYRISSIRRDDNFRHYIGLDYPGAEQAQRAHREGVISQRELQAIIAAHRVGGRPPQGTALGGHIGIHGLGRADPGVHETMNWTRGCIALTDSQVDALLVWVRIGMTVEIR